ncbi:MAG: hypothetical protein QW794_03050 [Thermosphaera sp.]
MLEYFRKWIIGPLRDTDAYRELAHSIGASERERPGMSRNNIMDHALGAAFLSEWKGKENVYISTAFYDVEAKLKGYAYLYYDFDSDADPGKAIEKGLEFSRSLRKKYGVDPVTYLSGFKGLGVIIPLKKYVDWEAYKALWQALVQPYSFKGILDTKVLDPRRLHRIPWTENIKGGERRMSKLVDLGGREVSPKEFDWDNYEPLSPDSVVIYRVELGVKPPKTIFVSAEPTKELPPRIEELDASPAVPPCIKNILITMKKAGDADHYARLVLVWYLRWVGFTPEDVVEFFARHASDFDEKVTRYQVEYAYGLRGSGKNYRMPSCRWMREHGLCLGCGWGGTPLSYTRAKALPRRARVDRNELSMLEDFTVETGRKEFTYEDFKTWLEARNGPLDASEWHRWERALRLLAEKCVLGRKYFVFGEWVDYGCGKVENPPSRIVKFYVK